MARRAFSGAGDYSGLFAGLYNFNRDSSRAERDAEDAEMANRWANGLITDEEWLNYIKKVIDREASDPKRQQKWIANFRKYSTLIADKQAEHAYEMGGSIDDLIAHYRQRMAGMEQDSNEYRELEERVSDLLDVRTGRDVQERAEQLIKQINTGEKTWADLKAMLQEALLQTRENSDLRSQIKKQLEQVNETIRVNKVEEAFEKAQYEFVSGKISGRTYGARLRKLAEQFRENDPGRYYQILQTAAQAEKYGSGGPGGGGGGGGARGGSDINDLIDAAMAERNYVKAIIDQFENGLKKGIDPRTGEEVVFSPETVRELETQYMNSLDKLTILYNEKGDYSAGSQQQVTKANFVSSNVVMHNVMEADETRRELLVATTKQIERALANPDPTAGMAQIKRVSGQWTRFAVNLEQQSADLMDRVPPEFINEARTFGQALFVLSSPTADEAAKDEAMQSLLALGGGRFTAGGQPAANTYASLGTLALEVQARAQGLETGEVVRIATPTGIRFAETSTQTIQAPSPDGTRMVPIQVTVPVAFLDGDKDLGVDGTNSKLVDVVIDVNGIPTKMKGIVYKAPIMGLDTWVAARELTIGGQKLERGAILTGKQIESLLSSRGLRSTRELERAGLIEAAPVMETYQATFVGGTDKNGNALPAETWYQDPETGDWYKGALPLRGISRYSDGKVRVGDDGKPMIDWRGFAHKKGVPTIYIGTDARAMQDLCNSDPEICGNSTVGGRNMQGLFDPTMEREFGDAYWTPFTPGRVQGGSWYDDDLREQRVREARERRDQRLEAEVGRAVQQSGLGEAEQAFLTNRQVRTPEVSQPMGVGGFAAGFSTGILNLARQLGIMLGESRPQEPEVRVPEPEMPRPSAGLAPRVELPLPTAKTGPEINLDLGDIEPPKPSPSPKPKPRPVPPAPKPYTKPEPPNVVLPGGTRF